jgi:hypothetical protein
MITRCAALAKGATKQTVTTEEKGMHRTSLPSPCSLPGVLTRCVVTEFDVPGDTTGVLQSGIPFLTLHHYMGGSWVSPMYPDCSWTPLTFRAGPPLRIRIVHEGL